MRVYFAGSQSCGKSTLARVTAKHWKLDFLNEIARTVLAERELSIDTLRVDLDVADSFQSEVFNRQIEEEKKHKSFVSDRTFDNLAYMAQHARKLKDVFESKTFQEYLDTLRKPDVTIFFVRPNKITMKNDGVRETLSWDGIIAIDAMIKMLFEITGIDYVQIDTASMQERVRLVDAVLNLKKTKLI